MSNIKYHFANAVINHKHIVCAVVLRPLCIGHLVLLDAINSPVINTDVTKMNEQMFWFTVLICGMTYEDGKEFVESFLYDGELYKKQCKRFSKNLLKDIKRKESWSIKVENLIFNDYLSYYLDSMPQLEKLTDTNNLPSGMDWKASTTCLLTKLNYSEKQINNMNLRELFYLVSCHLENEGAVRVTNTCDIPVTITVYDKDGNIIK